MTRLKLKQFNRSFKEHFIGDMRRINASNLGKALGLAAKYALGLAFLVGILMLVLELNYG